MEYISEIIVAIIFYILGIATMVIRIKIQSKKIETRVNQSGSVVGGDQAGHDINKKA